VSLTQLESAQVEFHPLSTPTVTLEQFVPVGMTDYLTVLKIESIKKRINEASTKANELNQTPITGPQTLTLKADFNDK
jgi:hypothetical protein